MQGLPIWNVRNSWGTDWYDLFIHVRLNFHQKGSEWLHFHRERKRCLCNCRGCNCSQLLTAHLMKANLDGVQSGWACINTLNSVLHVLLAKFPPQISVSHVGLPEVPNLVFRYVDPAHVSSWF